MRIYRMGAGEAMSFDIHDFDGCPAKTRIEYLERRDEIQNGTMGRIEKKVDRILWAIIGGLGAVVMALVACLTGGLFG